ncbi:hypothetical protein [Streptomyces olivoreticuli]|uniref:hypothetical protein n=1 Tax=Streptomyces olivoreticuli TaxID=68246 RepID=UPI0013C326B1|nr:hypothetical protein [Streptomyces olivoreticuli]
MITLIVGFVAAAIAIAAIWHNALEGRRAHVRQSEQFYLGRYWRLLDKLPAEALAEALKPQDSPEPGPELSRISLLYLRVSEDACEQRQRGEVSDPTWRIRSAAMRNQINRWPICTLWEKVNDPNGQFPLLGNLMKNDPYDPCTMKKPYKYLRGLTPGFTKGPE